MTTVPLTASSRPGLPRVSGVSGAPGERPSANPSAPAQNLSLRSSLPGHVEKPTQDLGTSANKGATPSESHIEAGRRRHDAMRRVSSQWLISSVMEVNRKGLKHLEGDIFVTADGELVERSYLRPPRIATCAWSLGKTVTVEKNPLSGRAHVGGIQTCASIWACPHCASVIRRGRAREIAQAVARHQKAGGHLAFLTLTLRHSASDALALTLDTVMDGWKNITRNRAWRELKAAAGVMGFIRATEVTYSESSGWHPHAHILLFLDAPLTEEVKEKIESTLFDPWARWCKKKTGKEPLREYGLDLQPVDEKGEVLSQYISKLQLEEVKEEPWGVDAELARMDVKAARKTSVMPFSLLEEGTDLAPERKNRLWLEYVHATRGRRAITWSRGLKSSLGVGEVSDETVLEQESQGAITRYEASSRNYNAALRAGAVPTLLEAAEREDWDGVYGILPGFRIPVHADGDPLGWAISITPHPTGQPPTPAPPLPKL